MTLVYLDTNVLMDVFLDRDHHAYLILRDALLCKYEIALSDVVIEELGAQNLRDECRRFMAAFKDMGKLMVGTPAPQELVEARRIAKTGRTHFQDALHAVIAARMGADFLVTWNVRDFRAVTSLRVRMPDEL